jgi:hypothetical protein
MGSKQERLLLSRALAGTADRRPDAVGCCDIFCTREWDKRGSASKSGKELNDIEVIFEARIARDEYLGCDIDGNRIFLASTSIYIRASAMREHAREKYCDGGDQ